MATDRRLAEKAATWEREPGPRDADMPSSPSEPERATEDTLIERSDLGPGASTLVAAGDPIPAELAGLPRRAADPRPARSRKG